MSWNIGFSRNLVLKLQNKLGLFHIVLQENSQKFSLTVLESQNLPKLQDLDTESQISQFEWTLHNGRLWFPTLLLIVIRIIVLVLLQIFYLNKYI